MRVEKARGGSARAGHVAGAEERVDAQRLGLLVELAAGEGAAVGLEEEERLQGVASREGRSGAAEKGELVLGGSGGAGG
ncbi:hypothetical protein BH11MYX4_BH11MYX4_63770 [soil metagenome]